MESSINSDIHLVCGSSSEMEGWVGGLTLVLTGECHMSCGLWGFGDV